MVTACKQNTQNYHNNKNSNASNNNHKSNKHNLDKPFFVFIFAVSFILIRFHVCFVHNFLFLVCLLCPFYSLHLSMYTRTKAYLNDFLAEQIIMKRPLFSITLQKQRDEYKPQKSLKEW